MANQESRERSGGKPRAVLLLSLILLVWNAVATAQRIVPNGFLPSRYGNKEIPFERTTSVNNKDLLSVDSPRSGLLTIRQKYLLGKRVDINKASLAEISELPGISDRIAAAVIEERNRLGGFRSREDLLGVKGIKEKRLKIILPFLSEIQNN